jgi:hypothetical protein
MLLSAQDIPFVQRKLYEEALRAGETGGRRSNDLTILFIGDGSC